MSDPSEPESSPYRAPDASLEVTDADSVISSRAMRSLASTKWWMRLAAIALMVNGVCMAIAVVWVLLTIGLTFPRAKFLMALLLIAALIIFIPGFRLMQSSLALTRAEKSHEEKDIVDSLQRHEEFWRFLGIAFLLLGVLFYFLVFFLRM